MRYRKYLFLIPILLVCIGIPATLLYWTIVRPEENVKNSLRVYPNAAFIVEDQGRQGGDISLKSVYYQSSSPMQDVQTYYENIFPKFLSGNADKEWLITAFDKNNRLPQNNNPKSIFLSHHSFCERQQPYGCVSIVLINIEQQDISQLPVISPQMVAGQPILPALKNISKKGTLIIYSYFIQTF
jgi:hypothetical protein